MSALSIRIDLPNGTRLGPGKAALLEAIVKKASISQAAKHLGMSYPRALKLIEQMNASFDTPLIETQHGGATGGGAQLTPRGVSVLASYKAIVAASLDSTEQELETLLSWSRR